MKKTKIKFRKIKLNKAKLNFFLEKERNVLLIGKHGVGKTTIAKQAFEDAGLVQDVSYKIFSGATLDPWTDFVGIPKRFVNPDTGEEYIDYIRPKHMDDSLQAIFMDEFNRAKPKVRNALMELIQFKSINGRKFPNLKLVWAAINPDDDENLRYDVEELDPAQQDRFHVIIEIPYMPDKTYFSKKFGKHRAVQTIQWWNGQGEAVQDAVSPRRLDYALEYFEMGGDIADVLPINSNVKALKDMLKQNPILVEFKTAFDNNNVTELSAIINDENKWGHLETMLMKDVAYFPLLGNNLKDERLSILLMKYNKFFDWASSNVDTCFKVKSVLESIYDANETNKLDNERKAKLEKIFAYKTKTNVVLTKKKTFKTLDNHKVMGYNPSNATTTAMADKCVSYAKLKGAKHMKSVEFFHKSFYKKLISVLVDPTSWTDEHCAQILSTLNALAKACPDIVNEDSIAIANTAFNKLIDTGALKDEMYFYSFQDFNDVMMQKNLKDKFIFVEKSK